MLTRESLLMDKVWWPGCRREYYQSGQRSGSKAMAGHSMGKAGSGQVRQHLLRGLFFGVDIDCSRMGIVHSLVAANTIIIEWFKTSCVEAASIFPSVVKFPRSIVLCRIVS